MRGVCLSVDPQRAHHRYGSLSGREAPPVAHLRYGHAEQIEDTLTALDAPADSLVEAAGAGVAGAGDRPATGTASWRGTAENGWRTAGGSVGREALRGMRRRDLDGPIVVLTRVHPGFVDAVRRRRSAE